MHVKTKKISFLGLLLALNILLQLLGSYVEVSTLTFMVISSLCLGIAIYETNLTLGGAFLIASAALSFLLLPDKFHCLTYICLCLYIYFQEVIRRKTFLWKHQKLIWVPKLIFFNLFFLFPALSFFPELLFATKIQWNFWVYVGVILFAQGILILFDIFYNRFIPGYWIVLKKRLRIDL
ncbi:MAG: hypothetical protein HFI75_10485 [Lachnospiraceae bacterium]|nr:hypothetical protein [Lachnospiraceae bacterium]